MTLGIALALATSLTFGVSDGLAALSARLVGTVRTTAGSLLVSMTILLVVALILHFELPADPAALLPVAALGVMHGLSYFTFVRALQLGPVSVVGPLTASAGVVTVVLAVILLGEHPRPVQLAAVPVAGLGCILAVLRFDRGAGGRPALIGLGPLFAGATCVLGSLYTIGLTAAIHSMGWVTAVVVSRALSVSVALAVVIGVVGRTRRRAAASEPAYVIASDSTSAEPSFAIASDSTPAVSLSFGALRSRLPGRPTRRAVLLVGVIGVTAATGQLTRALALERTPAWLVGLIASTSPVIVLGIGLTLMHERLTRTQWTGVALVGTGVLLVTLG
ncbi:MAG: hypothetical protein QOH61_1837 [Chloroflexota bacterium]|jgi:drug/metabolite transporter (DMT)-like permease|nr:hypothetical protein [Chloroflexota bacterium]